MLFEWDDEKARANIKKHGIDFETARKRLKFCGKSKKTIT
jgi:uncharacterized DUF497 family protein